MRSPAVAKSKSEEYIPKASTDTRHYLNHIPAVYHTVHHQGIIEPQTGWFLQGRNIIAESYPYWTNVSSGWPPLPSLMRYLNPFKKTVTVDRAVSFHYGWNNYYHFFVDTLPQLKYWQMHGDPALTWIIPAYVQEVRFVQDYLRFDPLFEGRNIVYQAADSYVKVLQEVHFVKRSRFDRSELFAALDLLKTQLPFPDGNRRVFLTRRGYRSLVNAPEIESIAQELGFEIVETSQMSLAEQVELFAATRHLVGIHGAGLTNMLFRQGRTLSVLELFPANKVPAHYWQLAKGLGFKYTFLTGGDLITSDQFVLDTNLFKQKLNEVLRDDPSDSL